MHIVIKVGGSLCVGKDGPKEVYFRKLISVLRNLSKTNKLILCVGGGRLTRSYEKLIKNFKLSNKEKEEIFVDLVNANNKFLAFAIGVAPCIDLNSLTRRKRIQVVGASRPGISTDADAAMAASKIGADLFIKLTNVDGIYTKDPRKYKHAKKMDFIPFTHLMKEKIKPHPNNYGVLDYKAIEIISKNEIPTIVCNGKNPKVILDILKGKKVGTFIGKAPVV
ncbi:MAG: hypothetical protein J7J92_02805 [Candidatus Aenigmarchaeota archaeon]|nr:hypothetical protein [Candidatus Aenigmarchaeota archaeon]